MRTDTTIGETLVRARYEPLTFPRYDERHDTIEEPAEAEVLALF